MLKRKGRTGKACALVTAAMLTLSVSGCRGQDMVMRTAISQIEQSSHAEQLHEYDSPYTICYRNRDNTYSMYIFASPIQFETADGYEIIDNTVIESKRGGYVLENKANVIKTYFPKTLEEYFLVEKGNSYMEFRPSGDVSGFSEAKQAVFTNMYGDKVSAVMYTRQDMDMVFYPTKAGIKSEIVLKEKKGQNRFAFQVRTSGVHCENRQNGYLLFRNEGGEIESIVYQPLVQYETDEGEQLDVTTQLESDEKGDEYHVDMIVGESIINSAEYPVKLDPSFELYVDKMPDTSVYSKFDTNSYLRHYAVIGEHPVLGEGWEYVRLRLNYYMTLITDRIIDASYTANVLSSTYDLSNMTVWSVKDQWSSTQDTWSKHSDYQDYISCFSERHHNIAKTEMTEFIKECFDDPYWQMESYGVVFRQAESEQQHYIVSTSDNSLYSPYLEMKMLELPGYFDVYNIDKIRKDR